MHLLYDGPSLLDGTNIVVLATGDKRPSDNRKTGPMLQTWILCKDVTPTYAMSIDLDKAVCGDCQHRKGSCYVNVGQAPQGVWNAWNRRYWDSTKRLQVLDPTELAALGTTRPVRLGAYGDPAAAPFEIWESLTSNALLHTGYTHQWRTCDQRLKHLCMASVDTIEQKWEAQRLGWRTFSVLEPGALRTRNEALCPASEEAGAKLKCIDCGACNGTLTNRNGNIAINVHGAAWKQKRFVETTARIRAEEAQAGLQATGTG